MATDYFVICALTGEMGGVLKSKILGPFYSPEDARSEAQSLGMGWGGNETLTVCSRGAMTPEMIRQATPPKFNTKRVKKDPTRIPGMND